MPKIISWGSSPKKKFTQRAIHWTTLRRASLVALMVIALSLNVRILGSAVPLVAVLMAPNAAAVETVAVKHAKLQLFFLLLTSFNNFVKLIFAWFFTKHFFNHFTVFTQILCMRLPNKSFKYSALLAIFFKTITCFVKKYIYKCFQIIPCLNM